MKPAQRLFLEREESIAQAVECVCVGHWPLAEFWFDRAGRLARRLAEAAA